MSLDKKAKIKPKGQTFFQGQTRHKKAKIELFGLKKAKLPTLRGNALITPWIFLGHRNFVSDSHSSGIMRICCLRMQPRPQGHLCGRGEEIDDPGKGCPNLLVHWFTHSTVRVCDNKCDWFNEMTA